jgi:hypothetical protein
MPKWSGGVTLVARWCVWNDDMRTNADEGELPWEHGVNTASLDSWLRLATKYISGHGSCLLESCVGIPAKWTLTNCF